MVRQFAYVHRVAGISLLSGKKYKVWLQFFSHSRNTTTTNPNHKIGFSTSCAPAWANRPKPPLHGLSLRKSPIKNHATLFRVGSGCQPDQTQLSSTKPNKSPTWRLVQSPTSNRYPPRNNPSYLQLILPILKLKDQLKLHTASTSQ